MRKLILAVSAATLAIPAALPAPAMAQGLRTHQGQSYRDHGRYRPAPRSDCRQPSGTTGLLLGGAAGAFAGREVDRHGERTTGTVLGAALGALLGRHVERNVVARCR
jgi:outer membrane lipoprotein SlyB